jgi:3-methyladenine DNA glycosylase AlkD
MKEIKKDYFRKVASEVARTKPQELQLLSLFDVRRKYQGYLSRYLRESGTRELLSMIKRKVESIGSKVTRYSELTLIS